MTKDLKTPERLNTLINIIKEYNQLTDDLAKAKNGTKLTIIQKVCNDFMNRSRINNEALVLLLEIYKNNDSLIQPIGLIVRSMLSDFLTSCYLMTFHDPKDSDEQSLKNELYILERDFLKSMLETIKLERSMHELNSSFKPVFANEDEYNEKLSSIKKLYHHLFQNDDINQEMKNIKELRDTSDNKFFPLKDKFANIGNGFMSEKYKFNRIKTHGFGEYSIAFIPFKYFSQFQHYSKKAIDMLEDDFQRFGFYHLVTSINLALIATHFQIQLIDGGTSKFIIRLDKLLPKLDDCL